MTPARRRSAQLAVATTLAVSTACGPGDPAGTPPCTVLTDRELDTLGLAGAQAVPERNNRAVTCSWRASDTKLLVAIGPGELDRMAGAIGLGASDQVTVADRAGRRVIGPRGCALLFQISPTNTLTIFSAEPGGAARSCDTANEAAELVLR